MTGLRIVMAFCAGLILSGCTVKTIYDLARFGGSNICGSK